MEGPTSLIGCAGWSLASAVAGFFPAGGSHLERYAQVLPAVEINSSFYRPHRPATYARWRDSVPAAFRFAVKVPKVITHERRLCDVEEPLARFLDEVGHLDEKLGCLLVQLPPSLRFEPAVAGAFFEGLRARTRGDVVCEPRHETWSSEAAQRLLADVRVGVVRADPQVVPEVPVRGEVAYYRLHGSPKIYHSEYSEPFLDALARELSAHQRAGRRTWCIFDNTASFAAVPNALSLLRRQRDEAPGSRPEAPR
ncbi:hypothetical protein D187_006167 [Cystobacter fuscus DSM 2262]|uniref:DUF72 domain-containing protein n=1 Tax=Cystobacter fuscus (strain ATCC 25194 / DSM 2262 / NBRC 100088 / M29) TaxID=1242864 RepID=S9R4E3_CYSF2|nr:DUF72 domain-containing protein [Cystobacter fuscus]EPX63758.1 hypothetical protein D187_006167 [Cystobacter fuscus DSM 2262]